jgi:predicted cupin superfamily sugar epimerase
MITQNELITLLQLEPLPIEGGYFRQTWIADHTIGAGALPARYGRPKVAGTAIYYLLTDDRDSFSAFHRLPTDEIYHFYLGDPVEQWLLHESGTVERVVLGQDLPAGHRVQHAVPRGTWQGSRVATGGRLALLGTTMAPGFDPGDYEAGQRAALVRRYPEASAIISALTRA